MSRLRMMERYPRPSEAASAWPERELAEHRRLAVGTVPILIEMRGGGEVVGELERAVGGLLRVSDVDVRSREVEAFMLIAEEPIDRRDELRG